MGEWCYGSESISSCYFMAIVSCIYASLTFPYALLQVFGPTYHTTFGVQRELRWVSPFLCFGFYGYFIQQLSSNYGVLMFGTVLVYGSTAIAIHCVGIYCYFHIHAVHQMYRKPISPHIKTIFYVSGFVLISSAIISESVAGAYQVAYPQLIPLILSVAKLGSETIATWHYYLKIIYYARKGMEDNYENIKQKNPTKFKSLRTTLISITCVVIFGMGTMASSISGNVKNPMGSPLRGAGVGYILSMLILMIGVTILLRVGGSVFHPQSKPGSIQSNTYMTVDVHHHPQHPARDTGPQTPSKSTTDDSTSTIPFSLHPKAVEAIEASSASSYSDLEGQLPGDDRQKDDAVPIEPSPVLENTMTIEVTPALEEKEDVYVT